MRIVQIDSVDEIVPSSNDGGQQAEVVLPVVEPTAETNQPTQSASPQSSTLRLVAFGWAINILGAAHLIGNGLMLASLGPDGDAAAGLIATTQAVINGIVYGVLSSTAVELGIAVGAKKSVADTSQDQKIGAIIKTSWLVGISSNLLSTACFLSTRAIMPRVVSLTTGELVGDFFSSFVIGGYSEPMGGNSGIIFVKVENNVWIPLLLTIGYRLPALGLSYLFAKKINLGAFGVGLGPGISGFIYFTGTQFLFSRKAYQNMELYRCYIPNFKKHLKSFLNGGWKLALQRLSEWGNLFAIATTIGILSNTELRALTPAIQANALVGYGMQGMSQTAMMDILEDCKRKKIHLKNFEQTLSIDELEKFQELLTKNKWAFIKSNAASLALTAALSGSIYLARAPIIDLFLGSNLALEDYELAESLLLYMLIGLAPDSVRIISGGVLRGWGDLLFPTILSLILMTFIGVPAGFGFSYLASESALPFLWVRIATIFLSAAINTYRFCNHISRDNAAYLHGKDLLAILDALTEWEKPSQLIVLPDVDHLPSVLQEAGFQACVSLDRNSLFFLIHECGFGESVDHLKRLVADELADQMPVLLKKYKTRDAIIELLKEKSEASNQLVMDAFAKTLKGCKFYQLAEVPTDNIAPYKNSYIFVEKQLYYIRPSGDAEKVIIRNLSKFMEKLAELKDGSEDTELFLSDKQIQELVTSNSGHCPTKINIIVINSDGSILKARGNSSDKDNVIYIAYDMDKKEFYRLRGTPNPRFPGLAEECAIPIYRGSPLYQSNSRGDGDIIEVVEDERRRFIGSIQRGYGTY